jgi:hypothetical protein
MCLPGRAWEQAAGCAVPAGLEEIRGISEERIHMKQQVRCCRFDGFSVFSGK